jgi:hypothetical protein
MIVTTNMGLYAWDELTDTFSHEQLKKNWEAVDAHDHSEGKGKQIPTAGIANQAVTNAKLAENAVKSTNIENATIEDGDLKSPTSGAYKVIQFGGGAFPASTSTTKYFNNSGGALGAANGTTAKLFYLYAADYSINGKTQKLRIRAQQATVATGPGKTLTVGMYPVTAIAANAFTVGAVVAGSTVKFESTAANTLATKESEDFTLPANGYYIFGVATSGETAASSEHGLWFQLQTKYV